MLQAEVVLWSTVQLLCTADVLCSGPDVLCSSTDVLCSGSVMLCSGRRRGSTGSGRCTRTGPSGLVQVRYRFQMETRVLMAVSAP